MIRKHHHFMLGFTRKLILSLRRPVFAYLTTLSLSSIILFSFAFHYVEFGVNANLTEFFDSFYYSVTVTTGVGFGDIAPVTRIGKLLSIIMMFLSTALYVCFTGALAASILEIELEEFKKPND